jgi:uncharacterized membrane protein YcfT
MRSLKVQLQDFRENRFNNTVKMLFSRWVSHHLLTCMILIKVQGWFFCFSVGGLWCWFSLLVLVAFGVGFSVLVLVAFGVDFLF